MPTLIISGPAEAFALNPRSEEPITDRKTLMRFHGLVSEEECADIFDEPELTALGISGGHLRFLFDPKTGTLRIVTEYQVPRKLTNREIQTVLDATRAQWSDGCGSGSFDNFYGTVLSTTLAMALLNVGHPLEELGEYFVNAYPMDADESETQAEFRNTDVTKSQFDYLLEAASWGEPQAQFQLAQNYEDEESDDYDPQLAFEYYQKASEQGHLAALTFFGRCHESGTGTPIDLTQSIACFEKAVQQDYPLAMHCLGECYFEGRGVVANPSKGIELFRRGAELGDVGCSAELGDCYEFGKGVAIDLKKALELYQFCMENDFDAVEPAIKRVKKQLKKK
jgi:hypothetical protein